MHEHFFNSPVRGGGTRDESKSRLLLGVVGLVTGETGLAGDVTSPDATPDLRTTRDGGRRLAPSFARSWRKINKRAQRALERSPESEDF